ncbi:ATP-binding protein [Rhodococcus koreensis]|uniref:ATP-binding protein n=1 Tax=Rhodococcus koreensis TaxID=99653 RepID=UPI001F1277CE|nr:LuxR C-terminal-related transcriptional regulator [Rhodococcus koreensis]
MPGEGANGYGCVKNLDESDDGMAAGVRSNLGNLPLELTSFVGRRHEVAEARRLLSSSRLLTLTGVGGVGKTRLALRVAAEVKRAFRDGVWLVGLGDLRDPVLVPDTIATGLGLREQSFRPTLTMLAEYLRDRQLLLVLDNCEHLVDEVAKSVETLLTSCSDLRILATSREPLGIGGESAMRVPPLAVPDPYRSVSLRSLPRYESVTLFAERAAAALPGFELTEDNQLAVAQICSRLEGLPLPIELAAARLRAMSVTQILQRLTDRFKLLTGGSRVAPGRQQTLRLSMDWSFELCTTHERQLWARLSVFAGGFELDAAEEICADELNSGRLLDHVVSLVDKSILIREEPGKVVRYRLLETLREYGREKLQEAGEDSQLRRRHRDWYKKMALRAEVEWISPSQVELITRLQREQTNLREALKFSMTDPTESESGVEIAAALYPFWRLRSPLGEGRHWLDLALASQGGQPSTGRVKALCADSMLAGVQGDLRAAAARIEEARVVATKIGGDEMGALVTSDEGRLSLYAGDLAHAVACFESAVNFFRKGGNIHRVIGDLLGLGLACGLNGDIERAVACHEEVLSLAEPRGESVYRSYALWILGMLVAQQGDPVRATTLLEQGLQLTRVVDDPLTSAWCLEALAWIAAGDQRAQRAAILLGSAESLGKKVGGRTAIVPNLLLYHEECERRTRRVLGDRAFQSAYAQGEAFGYEEALAYALDEQFPTASPASTSDSTTLTKRELEVATLVAQGLTNRAIATKLVISQRTAQGHVEHVLAKLGFTSRAQIAAWMVEQTHDEQNS